MQFFDRTHANSVNTKWIKEMDSDIMNFLTKKRLTKMIEENIKEVGGSYIDAVVNICEKNKIDIEDIGKFISPVIKGRIEHEGQQLNMLIGEKGNTLPDGI
jgi:hypothetical protein